MILLRSNTVNDHLKNKIANSHCHFSSSIGNEDSASLLEKLTAIKQELNDVKSLLSDKDIIDWNRFEHIVSLIIPT